MREMSILDLQKQITEADYKLKQQQNMYEAVRSDRNLYSKNLIESQDEIAEMKRKFKIMNHQIEQLKEEITAGGPLLKSIRTRQGRKGDGVMKQENQKIRVQIVEAATLSAPEG